MKNIKMTTIIEKANELDNNLMMVHRELKRVASAKCRLKKMPARLTYDAEMTVILQEEQLLKNVRDYLSEPRKNVNTLTQEDIDAMSYDEVCKAIRCISSKKTHTRWAEDCQRDENGLFIPGTGAQFNEACRIEDMLKARRAELKPVDTAHVSKLSLLQLIENLRLASDLDVETCLSRVEEFVKGGKDDENND